MADTDTQTVPDMYAGGMSIAAIATRLGLSEPTVRASLRARGVTLRGDAPKRTPGSGRAQVGPEIRSLRLREDQHAAYRGRMATTGETQAVAIRAIYDAGMAVLAVVPAGWAVSTVLVRCPHCDRVMVPTAASDHAEGCAQ